MQRASYKRRYGKRYERRYRKIYRRRYKKRQKGRRQIECNGPVTQDGVTKGATEIIGVFAENFVGLGFL